MNNLIWIVANLKVQFYEPFELEEKMWFMNSLYPGTDREFVELWELDEVPEDQSQFIEKNGFPVDIFVTIENSNPDKPDDIIANPEEIYWIDRNIYSDGRLDAITIKDVNLIIQNFGGEILIMIDEDDFDKSGIITPYFEESELGKHVLLKINYETEDEEEIYEPD